MTDRQPPPKLPIAPWREGFVETGEVRLHYLEWGDRAACPLLLLHGIAQTAHTWAYFATEMKERCRVLALDQRGHGDSGWAPGGDYSSAAYGRDLEAFIDILGLESFLLVGFSLGGRNAMSLAARRPDRVRRLAVIDAPPERPAAGRSHVRRFITGPDVFDSIEAAVERALQFNPRRSRESLRASLPNNLRRLPDGRWTWKYDPVLRDPHRPPSPAENLWPVLDKIRCPTLIVRAEESPVLPAEVAERMARAIPRAELATVSAAGHNLIGDNPREFAAKVKPFLLADPALGGPGPRAAPDRAARMRKQNTEELS